MNQKIIIGIIIMCFLAIVGVVIYLQNKLKHKESSLNTLKSSRDDLTNRFRYAWWVINNQNQTDKKATDPTYPQITKDQSDCLFDSIVSTYGLNDSLSAFFITGSIEAVLLEGKNQYLAPIKETMDLFTSAGSKLSGSPCDYGKSCGIPSSFFNKDSTSGSPPVCTY